VIYIYNSDLAFVETTSSLQRPEIAASDVATDPATGDIALAIRRWLERSPLEAENALRHAIAHVILRRASGGRIPRGFDEGFASYAEHPVSARLARGAALVHTAYRQGELLTWSDLNRPAAPAGEPELILAHSYSVVAFLIERQGLREFGDFVTSLKQEPDWRAAMRVVYKRSPSELEEQWQTNIPRWAAGGWRENLFAAFDLQPARELLAKAHYAAAKRELERSLRLFTDLGDIARQAEVEALLHQGDLGLQAEALMSQTRQALENHTYDRARTLITQAQTQYDQLPPDQRPADLIAAYAELADLGLLAEAKLAEGQRLAQRWTDFPEARAAVLEAGAAYARLGDDDMWTRAQEVLTELDARQRRVVLLLGALAILTAAWLAVWLWARGPADLQWDRPRWTQVAVRRPGDARQEPRSL
jgi:hypothetical protein